MNNETEQVLNPVQSKYGRYSLWLGMAGIVLFVVGRVFAYAMYDKNTPDMLGSLMQTIEGPISALGLICGLLAIFAGRIAFRQNKKTGGNRKDKAAQAGTVLGILAFIPACLFICGYLLLALATGY